LYSKPSSPDPRRIGGATTVNRREKDEDIDKDKETPVNKLLRNLSHLGKQRSLTSVLFGEKSPIVVVGDNRGTVTVYRVSKPVLITNEGPVQQMDRLRDAILRQSDPLEAVKLNINSNTN
jgi:hypothetical protein